MLFENRVKNILKKYQTMSGLHCPCRPDMGRNLLLCANCLHIMGRNRLLCANCLHIMGRNLLLCKLPTYHGPKLFALQIFYISWVETFWSMQIEYISWVETFCSANCLHLLLCANCLHIMGRNFLHRTYFFLNYTTGGWGYEKPYPRTLPRKYKWIQCTKILLKNNLS